MHGKSNQRMLTSLAWIIVIGAIGAAIWFGKSYWQPIFEKPSAEVSSSPVTPGNAPKIVELGAEARANLKLTAAPVKAQTYWRKILIPGVVEDRPGMTDRGITAPLSGVITHVHAFEGDVVRPGDKLFTIRPVSEYLQQIQSDLFEANREIEILKLEIGRIRKLVAERAVPKIEKLRLEDKIRRQAAKIDSCRQDLKSRGLSQRRIDSIQQGDFLTSIDVVAQDSNSETKRRFFEIQQLKVELGQQVETGSVLVVLANHRSLYVKGHAFKREASRLAKAAEEGWNVEVEFTEDVAADWPKLEQEFHIRHLANTTNPNSRTFEFFIPLENQMRTYEKEGRSFVLWRFRPGQRVSIGVPVEEMKDVLVLPAEAVTFEGPEAFVFQQNGDLFNRIPVEVLHRDRNNVVLANDGSISPGFYLAQNSAAALNRIMKSQAASGVQPGFHMHADGTVHGAH